jgi:hypothetical protein
MPMKVFTSPSFFNPKNRFSFEAISLISAVVEAAIARADVKAL